ncbi:hypothetical protein BMG05_16595 [Mycobacterium malmoense]|nr:hypothetical protein BMG05_16595 [Mycobacterium malmoense]
MAWLAEEFGADGVGMRRPSGAVLPYRMVGLVTGTEREDKTQRCGIVSVHTFADSMDGADDESDLAHQRMVVMGPPLYGPQEITITLRDGTTQVVSPRSLVTKQIPVWVDYEVDTIFRFVGRYEICVPPLFNG